MTTSPESEHPAMNLAVLRGVTSSPATVRELESGRRLAALSVRVPSLGSDATSVPVTVWDPPAWVTALDADEPVVVVGALRRRFYQSSGGVGARVEVESVLVGRGTDRRRRDAARRRADDALDALE